MSAGRVVGGGRAMAILARVAFHRLLRGKVWWIAGLIALGPIAMGAAIPAHEAWPAAWRALVALIIVVPPLLVASAVSEEIEERTYTYLWSRPLPRWSMVGGKLLAGWPLAAAVLGASAAITFLKADARGGIAAGDGASLPLALVATVVGVLGTSMVSAGIAALAPRLAQRLAYFYLAIDLLLGALDISLKHISVSYHFRTIGYGDASEAGILAHAIWCVALGAVWLAIGLLRLRRAEYADGQAA